MEAQDEFSARNFSHIHDSSPYVVPGEEFKHLPFSDEKLYPLNKKGNPIKSYGFLKDIKTAKYLRLNEHLNNVLNAGLFPEDFGDRGVGEKFISILKADGKPAKVLKSMVKAYSKRKASKFSTAKRMKCMLNAGVVATFDEDFVSSSATLFCRYGRMLSFGSIVLFNFSIYR